MIEPFLLISSSPMKTSTAVEDDVHTIRRSSQILCNLDFDIPKALPVLKETLNKIAANGMVKDLWNKIAANGMIKDLRMKTGCDSHYVASNELCLAMFNDEHFRKH